MKSTWVVKGLHKSNQMSYIMKKYVKALASNVILAHENTGRWKDEVRNSEVGALKSQPKLSIDKKTYGDLLLCKLLKDYF